MAAYGQSSFGIAPPQSHGGIPPPIPGAPPHAPPPQSIEKPIVSIINHAKPILMALLKAADAAGPILAQGIRQGKNLWAAIQPYHPQDWFPIFFGLTLIFFGGQFPVLLAAVEAFRICGWPNTKRAILLIWDQFQIALEASKKDDLLDENNDGIPDVLQIQGSELVSRKVMLFFRCTDPKSLNEGVQGVTAGCSAVIATLRLHFAQTLTLGVSLGDVFTRTADQVLRPALEATMPKEQHKWIGMVISYGCRSVAVTIAWWCTRIISAMHSATRGAQMLILGINLVARRYNVHIPFDLTDLNPAYPIICGSLAGLGLYTQIMRGFSLPFPLNILLLPVRLLEWILYYVLAYHGLYTNN